MGNFLIGKLGQKYNNIGNLLETMDENMKVNPFKPGSPVPPGIFAGRSKELAQIQKSVIQTSYGSPQNVLIIGERGIGKTSVAFVAKGIAEQNVMLSFNENPKNPLITAYIGVQKNTPSAIVITRLVEELEEKLSQYKTLFNSVVEYVGGFVKKFKSISCQGVKLELADGEIVSQEEIYYEAKKAIRKCVQACAAQEKGQERAICLIIDELDRMKDFDSFSSFWKTLQETLAADGASNLMLIMIGMPKIIDYLNEDHESFLRTFTPIALDRMNKEDAREVIQKAIRNSGKTVDEGVIQKILLYSERFPHLIQELGFSAFEVAQGDKITEKDVETGIHGNEDYPGSVQRLGELFFSRMYNEVRKSLNFKEILKVTAEQSGEEYNWVTRQDILKEFSLKKSSLDSAIRTLIEKKILVRNPDKEGEYRLFSKMFQVYIAKIFN